MNSQEDYSKAPKWLAFISYSHTDNDWAAWLQEKLEFYRLPSYIATEYPNLPSSLRPIFRDLTDLQLGDLSSNIKDALDSSKFLIVICSKNAVKSHYVNSEISYFLNKHDNKYLIPFIIDGVPHSNDVKDECFPEALRRINTELLAANINELGKDYAAVKVVSKLLGGLDTLRLWDRYQEAEEQERIRLKEANDHLLDLTSRASAVKAQDLLKEDNNAIAAKVALANIEQNTDNSHQFPSEVEFLLRTSTMGNAGSFYQLCHYPVSDYVFPKIIQSNNEHYLALTDDLMLFLFDALSLRRISVDYSALFEDTETVRFNDECTLLLNCGLREFAVFDILNKTILCKLSFCKDADDETANKAFLHHNDEVVIVSQHTVRLYSIKESNWILNKRIAHIFDSFILGDEMILIVKQDEHSDNKATAMILNLKTGTAKELASGNKWNAASSSCYISCLLDKTLYIKGIQDDDFSVIALDGYNYMHSSVSDDGVSLLYDSSNNKGCVVVSNTHSAIYISNIARIKLSPKDKWGVYIDINNDLYCFDINENRIVSKHLFSASSSALECAISSCHRQILIVDSSKICHLFDKTTTAKLGERILGDNTLSIYFSSINRRFTVIEKKCIRVVEWEPIAKHFDFHPKLQMKKEYGIVRPYFITADTTSDGRRQINDFPKNWGDPSYLYAKGRIELFSSFLSHLPVKADITGMEGFYFMDGKVLNNKDEVVVSCEHFSADNIEKLEAIALNKQNLLFVGAKYSFISQCILYIWAIDTGKQVFSFKIEDPYYSLDINEENEYVVFGRHVFEFPSISNLISRARVRYNDVELTDDDKTNFYLL